MSSFQKGPTRQGGYCSVWRNSQGHNFTIGLNQAQPPLPLHDDIINIITLIIFSSPLLTQPAPPLRQGHNFTIGLNQAQPPPFSPWRYYKHNYPNYLLFAPANSTRPSPEIVAHFWIPPPASKSIKRPPWPRSGSVCDFPKDFLESYCLNLG